MDSRRDCLAACGHFKLWRKRVVGDPKENKLYEFRPGEDSESSCAQMEINQTKDELRN